MHDPWWTKDGKFNPHGFTQALVWMEKRIRESGTSIADIKPLIGRMTADVRKEHDRTNAEWVATVSAGPIALDPPHLGGVEDRRSNLREAERDTGRIRRLLRDRARMNCFPMP